MPLYNITPWKYHSELLQVRREIYRLGDLAPPADERRHAVNWIAAWKMRGNLPHAVESTAHLVDAVLHHDATKNSTFSIRATYSAAFCRFVTGFCDIAQVTYGKRSMIDVARDIDMPASFVELRHEATHEELPSLQRLAQNAKLALDWLWQHYWAKLDEEASTVIKKSGQAEAAMQTLPSNTDIRITLSTFLSSRRQEIKSGAKDPSQTSASSIACLELIRLCKGQRDALRLVALNLVEEKMLIPSNRTPSSSMTGAFLLWGNLLRRLTVHQSRFLSLLTDRLTSLLTRPSSHLDPQLDTFREAIYEWLAHIFCSIAPEWSQQRIAGRVAALRGTVVNECVMAPNLWALRLARRLVEGGDGAFREQWTPLLEIAAAAVDEA